MKRRGILLLLLLLVPAWTVLGQVSNYQVLHSFCAGGYPACTDGDEPNGGLIRDAAGNLYGTTTEGGANGGGGTVFKLDNTGNETVLYSFCADSNCTDGAFPLFITLTQDTAGNLYGTTSGGGANSFSGGTVFMVDPTGHETVLYSFCSVAGCADGQTPYGGVIRDAGGNLYGTTAAGGNPNTLCSNESFSGCGTVFKLDPTGHETVLYSFCSVAECADGYWPGAGLILDASGNLFGTTILGGANGQGTVFKLDSTGNYTVLYSFCSAALCADGGQPGGLIQDAVGNLYGMASDFGAGNDGGTVFKLAPPAQPSGAWTLTVLYSFCSAANCADGDRPFVASLTQDAADNLYGTTTYGGSSASGGGIVFKLAPPIEPGGAWAESVLYNFCSASGCSDGENPQAGLVQDAAGNLYGTTEYGGNPSCPNNGCGTVFKLAAGGVPSLSLSTSSLSFASQPVGTTSSPATLTVTNNGAANLAISTVTISGTNPSDFAKSADTCTGATVAPNNTCTVSVTFTPSATGSRSASLNFTDNASNSPQTVSLSGTGAGPVVSLSAPPTFPSEPIGTTSPSQTVTLTNTGGASLTFTAISVTGPFATVASGTTCSTSSPVGASASCTVAVTFTPTAAGTASGSLSFSDNAPGSPQTIALSGTGQDFTLAAGSGSPTTVTVAPGSTASYTLSVGGEGGFNQSVSFTCTGAPSEATCTVSPSPVTPGSSATNITVSVTTTAPSVGAPRSRPLPPVPPLLPGLRGLLMSRLDSCGHGMGHRAEEAGRREPMADHNGFARLGIVAGSGWRWQDVAVEGAA